jgi:hypothetical protein
VPASVATFSSALGALRQALAGTGLKESPLAFDGPQGASRQHRGYRVEILEVANTNKLSDRSRALLRYSLSVTVTHRIRPSPEDGFEDLAQAGTDYGRVIEELMGDVALNRAGLLALGKFEPKRILGEWIEAPVRLSLDIEHEWRLDGEQEEGP